MGQISIRKGSERFKKIRVITLKMYLIIIKHHVPVLPYCLYPEPIICVQPYQERKFCMRSVSDSVGVKTDWAW